MPLYGSTVQIGTPVVGATSGSVLFVDSSLTLAQDNTKLFWDNTNDRLCIGTNTSVGKLTIVANSAADVLINLAGTTSQSGDYINIVDSAAAGVMKVAADKSFSLYGDQQYWLGTSMTITDQLSRDIITASAVVMTIAHVNLSIEEIIECQGPIEVQDTVDLNKVTGEQLRILPDNTTLVGGCIAIALSSTVTFDTASDSFNLVKSYGEFHFTTGPSFGIPPVFFSYIPTIRCSTNNMSISGTAVYYNQVSVIADGIVVTYNNLFPSFFDSPQFSIANGGSFNSTSNYAAMRSEMVVNTGVTFNQRSGFRVANATGAGTITTQIGYFCGALTKGGTANNPILINAPDTANASGSMIDGNITFFATAGSYGGGSRVLFMSHATTAPSSDPTGGFVIWSSSTGLKCRGPSGTVTTLAAV